MLWQVAEDNTICGVVTEGNLTAKLMSGRVKPSDPVTAALYPQFRKVAMDTSLGDLARMFDKDHFAIVVTTQRCYAGAGLPVSEKSVVAGVVSRYGGVGGGLRRGVGDSQTKETDRLLLSGVFTRAASLCCGCAVRGDERCWYV